MIEIMITEDEVDGNRKRLRHLGKIFRNSRRLRNVARNQYGIAVLLAQFPQESAEREIAEKLQMNVC